MTALISEPGPARARKAAQVVVLLDEKAQVLSVSRGRAGSGFLGLTEDQHIGLHSQLHPDCDGQCRFSRLWRTAWKSIAATESVEWEIDDPILGRLLRLNLARPPTARDVKVDRRRRYAMLTITDITRYRREYESLVAREQALMQLLRERGIDARIRPAGDGEPADGALDALDASPGAGDWSTTHHAFLAQELERKRIALELHDGLTQSAGAIKYRLEANLNRLAKSCPDADLSDLRSVVEQTRGLVSEIRRISQNLSPSILDDFGLCVALHELCDNFQSDGCDLQPSCQSGIDESSLPYIVKFTVYRVVQEALNNIVKHASADTASVAVNANDGCLEVIVSDDGVGFTPDARNSSAPNDVSGQGMGNMRSRVEGIRGTFSVESVPGQGTTVRASWSRVALQELLGNETVLNGVDSHR